MFKEVVASYCALLRLINAATRLYYILVQTNSPTELINIGAAILAI